MAASSNDVNLFWAVAEKAARLSSLYEDNRADRENLLKYMDANEWFGCFYVMVDKAPVVQKKHLKRFNGLLTLWLSAYKQPGQKKIRLMLEHYGDTYPETCVLFRKFIMDRHIENASGAWKLLDFLFSEIDREVTEYNEIDLEELIKRADIEVTLVSARLLADFLHTSMYKGKPLTEWVYDLIPVIVRS